jgi:uncharacterized protein (DUF2236 family)
MADLLPPNSLIRRVNAEPVVLFGAGRALLLQVAHPAVAQAVADHDTFPGNPFGRLFGTVDAMYSVVFGSEALATAVGDRVHALHERVVGATYRANDMENLVWVHATLCDSVLAAHARFGRALDADATGRYLDEMKIVAELFGVPRSALPSTACDFREYVDATVATLGVTDVGRQLAAQIVSPPFALPVALSLALPIALHRLVSIGTTPTRLRRALGLPWSAAEERLLDATAFASRAAFTLIPRALRVAPVGVLGRLSMRRMAHRVGEPSD